MNHRQSAQQRAGEAYVSVDIEAAGPVPATYSMLALGACHVEDPSQSFYAELQPINDRFVLEALTVGGFSLEQLREVGREPSDGRWLVPGGYLSGRAQADVMAALDQSNVLLVEEAGQNNKFKLIKRQGYGRAQLPLLRQRQLLGA
jgi:hypothetical protein